MSTTWHLLTLCLSNCHFPSFLFFFQIPFFIFFFFFIFLSFFFFPSTHVFPL